MATHSIVTAPVGAAQLFEELDHMANHFKTQGHTSCATVLGFAWGNQYYPGDWLQEETPLEDLAAKIRRIELSGLGRIGSDDLYVYVAGVEFLFCHEGDIHLEFEVPSEVTTHFFGRWRDLGYRPTLSGDGVSEAGRWH